MSKPDFSVSNSEPNDTAQPALHAPEESEPIFFTENEVITNEANEDKPNIIESGGKIPKSPIVIVIESVNKAEGYPLDSEDSEGDSLSELNVNGERKAVKQVCLFLGLRRPQRLIPSRRRL